LGFSQWCCWRLKSSAMCCCVTEWVVCFISADYSALNFRVRHCDPVKHWQLLSLHHSITSQKTWILRSRFVEHGSEINWVCLLTSMCVFCYGLLCSLLCVYNALMWLAADLLPEWKYNVLMMVMQPATVRVNARYICVTVRESSSWNFVSVM
jgi:hypothetical protein